MQWEIYILAYASPALIARSAIIQAPDACVVATCMHKAISYDLNQDYVIYEELHWLFIKGAKFAVSPCL